ncbi:hypothetical protein [Bacillus sp. ISL-55]|uniref:hypothetical protein n=1 Tax=Bacillus sp. ISL-55 TaxID=2819134 RepID=UPI001BE54F9E|nr:hypothetical protein [Bacillus sp. ISL-55]MBT2695629.1 hypothetical protein [Bacillus sp. ISL-55]
MSQLQTSLEEKYKIAVQTSIIILSYFSKNSKNPPECIQHPILPALDPYSVLLKSILYNKPT